MVADFASLDGMGGNIPTNGASVSSMQLTTPNSMITGTTAGLQQIGSPSLTVDSVKNLITVKPISTANTQILRYGQVATGYLGMAVNDGTNDTMFAGRDNTGATVVKIAKAGFDAKTASAANLVFNSSQDVFKIVGSGTLTSNIPGTLASNTTSTVSAAHNLGYVPAFLGYIISQTYLGSQYIQTPYTVTFNIVTGTPEPFTFSLTADTTNIYANVYNGGGVGVSAVGTTVFKYYLLQETAT